MKKLFYFLVFILIVGCISFVSLNYLHVKRIKIAVNGIKSSLADFQITMEFKEQTFDGYSFMNKNSKLKDVEIYTKMGDTVVYFNVPEISISSAFELFNSLDIVVTLPRHLDGYADLDFGITQKFNIEPKYELTIENLEPFKVNTHIQGVLSKNSSTNISFNSNNFTFKVKGINSKQDKEVFNIKSFRILSEISKKENLQWGHNINIDDLNIVLYPQRIVEYLPQNISIDEMSKNIFANVKIKKTTLPNTESITNKYDFNVGCFNKIFDVICEGNNLNEKYTSGQSKNRSDMSFEIKHFAVLVDYIRSIIIAIKKDEDNNFDPITLNDNTMLFKNIVLQNAEHKPDDVIFFTVKDIDKKTLFQNKPIEDVFGKFIEKMKEN